MNAIKKKRRLKRTMKVLKKNRIENDEMRSRIKLANDWNKLCTKLGWFN